MQNKKNIDVVAFRSIRKASHLINKVVRKGGGFLDKVESRSTRIIVDRTGSADARGDISVDDLIYTHLPHTLPVHPTLPNLGQKPSITVFAFLDPKGFYGGIATLLCVSAALANKLGYDFRVAQTTGFSKNTDVLGFLASKGILVEEERFSTVDLSKRSISNYGYLPLHPDDILVVSAWWDAQIASQLPLKNKFIYLIQDFEPIFYNNSDEYVFADQTYYSNKFLPILNTEILYEFFKENDYTYIAENAVWFEPAPAPNVPNQVVSKAKKTTKTIFLYGRPNVHRNLFYNAVLAIDRALQDKRMQKFDWEIFSAGSGNVPDVKLHSGHTIKNKGKMDVDDYYSFALSVDIAVSPMLAPHPNYPTLEIASLGATVVTTKWRTKQNLDRYSPNIFMADASVDSMAENIITAALQTPSITKSNLAKTNIGNNWTEALDDPISKLATKISNNIK